MPSGKYVCLRVFFLLINYHKKKKNRQKNIKLKIDGRAVSTNLQLNLIEVQHKFQLQDLLIIDMNKKRKNRRLSQLGLNIEYFYDTRQSTILSLLAFTRSYNNT